MIPIATAMMAPLRSLWLVSVAILLTGPKPTGEPRWLDRRHACPASDLAGTGGAGRPLGARAGPAGARPGARPRLPARPRHGVGPRPVPERGRARPRLRAAAGGALGRRGRGSRRARAGDAAP